MSEILTPEQAEYHAEYHGDSMSYTFWQSHEALRAELDLNVARLAECYRLTGADSDGNEDWRLAHQAVEEVRRLRADHDKAENERDALREELAKAKADFREVLEFTCVKRDEALALKERELAEARDVSYECRASGFVGEDGAGCGFGSNTPGDCPNCNRPLTPQTWKDRAMSAAAKIPALTGQLAEARAEIARLTTHMADLMSLRSAYGYLSMQMTLSPPPKEAFRIAEKEWDHNQAAFKRTEALLPAPPANGESR